jgi:hypothetical protein
MRLRNALGAALACVLALGTAGAMDLDGARAVAKADSLVSACAGGTTSPDFLLSDVNDAQFSAVPLASTAAADGCQRRCERAYFRCLQRCGPDPICQDGCGELFGECLTGCPD